ncbi:uncharacterized protein LOC108052385 [Drosophila rhopaloa]|uniref:Uncharacterized protein LOC108052385 n=1 Tax=Drosophila rhopaloa TaxID=1041015 RepID=A0A6P4FIF0_DRORH|nr:uncharacterized protein LOC108052385 [Drosophila rhopaloa]
MSQNVIRQPIPNDCNRFYETRLLSCPPEFYWNSELNQCKLQAPAGCYFTSPVPNWSGSFHNDSKPSPVAVQESHNLMEVCDKKLGQRIVYPGDCTRFIMCDFLPFVMSCPQYLFWNSHLLTCDKICV